MILHLKCSALVYRLFISFDGTVASILPTFIVDVINVGLQAVGLEEHSIGKDGGDFVSSKGDYIVIDYNCTSFYVYMFSPR